MKTISMLILAAFAALGTLYEAPTDKFSDALQPVVERHDDPVLVAQCGVQYGYGAGDCAASSYGAFGAYGAECAASPSAYSGYGMPYGMPQYVPRYNYYPMPNYATGYYGGAYYAPRYTQPYGYGFGFRVGW